MTSGSHYIVVQAWDTQGVVYKSAGFYITVTNERLGRQVDIDPFRGPSRDRDGSWRSSGVAVLPAVGYFHHGRIEARPELG